MSRKTGKQTIVFKNRPKILAGYTVVGPKEGEGHFSDKYDYIMKDDLFGEKSYEKAERKMIQEAITGAMMKAKIEPRQLELLISGDLMNQIISSTFAARHFNVPYIGIYGACSAMAEALLLGAQFVNGGSMDIVACATASHFSTAEKQFRFPLEQGNQRPPTAQWTVTGAGTTILSKNVEGEHKYIHSATIGVVEDYGINDLANMGAAMAPAARSTIIAHLEALNAKVEDYDLILTGDLGRLGADIFIELMKESGYNMIKNYGDCGRMIYKKEQNTLQGGSGCGCSASVLNSYIYSMMDEKKYNRVLFVATGALMSTLSTQQGDTIPCIAHAVEIRNNDY